MEEKKRGESDEKGRREKERKRECVRPNHRMKGGESTPSLFFFFLPSGGDGDLDSGIFSRKRRL